MHRRLALKRPEGDREILGQGRPRLGEHCVGVLAYEDPVITGGDAGGSWLERESRQRRGWEDTGHEQLATGRTRQQRAEPPRVFGRGGAVEGDGQRADDARPVLW